MRYGIVLTLLNSTLFVRVMNIPLPTETQFVYAKLHYDKNKPSQKNFFDHFSKYIIRPGRNIIFEVDSDEQFYLVWKYLLNELKKIYYILESYDEYVTFFEDFFYVCFSMKYYANRNSKCYEEGLKLMYPILNESNYELIKIPVNYLHCLAIKKDDKIYLGFHAGKVRALYIDLKTFEIVPKPEKPLSEKIKVCNSIQGIKTYNISREELIEILELLEFF